MSVQHRSTSPAKIAAKTRESMNDIIAKPCDYPMNFESISTALAVLVSHVIVPLRANRCGILPQSRLPAPSDHYLSTGCTSFCLLTLLNTQCYILIQWQQTMPLSDSVVTRFPLLILQC